MRVIDFEFDGVSLSDYGLTIVRIANDGSDGEAGLGNDSSINTVNAVKSDIRYAVSHEYKDVITLPVFEISKITCSENGDLHVGLTDEEYFGIIRWLCRKEYKELRFVYDDNSFANIYYKGYFVANPVVMNGEIVGVSLTFICNAPYAFMDDVIIKHTFSPEDSTLVIEDPSDEYGLNYCDIVTIECLEDCDINIVSKLETRNNITINGCKAGEIITMYGREKMIETTDALHSHTLANDFNYRFLRFKNDFREIENIFECTNKCNITIQYTPVRKVGGFIC